VYIKYEICSVRIITYKIIIKNIQLVGIHLAFKNIVGSKYSLIFMYFCYIVCIGTFRYKLAGRLGIGTHLYIYLDKIFLGTNKNNNYFKI